MKKFELIIKMGRKKIYHSIFSFTPEQEEQHLTSIGNEPNEFFESILREIGGGLKEFKNLDRDKSDKIFSVENLKSLSSEYPDVVIRAAIESEIYEISDWFRDVADTTVISCPEGVSEEVLCNELQNYSWECKRIH